MHHKQQSSVTQIQRPEVQCQISDDWCLIKTSSLAHRWRLAFSVEPHVVGKRGTFPVVSLTKSQIPLRSSILMGASPPRGPVSVPQAFFLLSTLQRLLHLISRVKSPGDNIPHKWTQTVTVSRATPKSARHWLAEPEGNHLSLSVLGVLKSIPAQPRKGIELSWGVHRV